jgi:hypothetical protein
MSEVNITLHKLDPYKDKVCKNCGRSYPEVILNLEGNIHHRTGYVCLDAKACTKYCKKHK